MELPVSLFFWYRRSRTSKMDVLNDDSSVEFTTYGGNRTLHRIVEAKWFGMGNRLGQAAMVSPEEYRKVVDLTAEVLISRLCRIREDLARREIGGQDSDDQPRLSTEI